MTNPRSGLYTAPLFLGTAFLLFALAALEKLLNLFGASIPLLPVFPRQVLEWAVIILMFEIALTLRQLVEEVRQPRDGEGDVASQGMH
jgi:hypothetical protein